jgi:UDP-2-acetamido-3-amino-2,3-dideoxy-glucuronate N-acetyltransferase
MVFTHIGYPRAAITRKSVFQKTLVKTGATLGANSTIVPGVTVGQGGFIGAGSVLTKSCKDWALMVGVPARQVGWVSAFGERIPLAISGNGHWKCNHTDDMYVLSDGLVVREPGTDDILLYRPGVRLQRRIFF